MLKKQCILSIFLSLISWSVGALTPSEHALFSMLPSCVYQGKDLPADHLKLLSDRGFVFKTHQENSDKNFSALHFASDASKESIVVFQGTCPDSPGRLLQDLSFLYGGGGDADQCFKDLMEEGFEGADFESLSKFYATAYPGQSAISHAANRSYAFIDSLRQSPWTQTLASWAGVQIDKVSPEFLLKHLKETHKKIIIQKCQDAVDFCLTIQHSYPDHTIRLVGHNLGGYVAQFVAAFCNLEGCSFGAPGAAQLFAEVVGTSPIDPEHMKVFVNYCREKDVITTMGNHIGICVSIGSADLPFDVQKKRSEKVLLHNSAQLYHENTSLFKEHPKLAMSIYAEDEVAPVIVGDLPDGMVRSIPIPPPGSPGLDQMSHVPSLGQILAATQESRPDSLDQDDDDGEGEKAKKSMPTYFGENDPRSDQGKRLVAAPLGVQTKPLSQGGRWGIMNRFLAFHPSLFQRFLGDGSSSSGASVDASDLAVIFTEN